MEIAFCINDAYSDKVAVVMTSILENNTNKHINFYIFSSDLTDKSLQKLSNLKFKYKNFTVQKINVPTDKFSKLHTNIDYISVETYFRYMIADLLPDIDKILYLDADLIVTSDISDLYDIDLGDNYIAGVEDYFIKQIGYKSEINFQDADIYINAGVLLMNLPKIRKDNLAQKFIAKSIALQNKIKFQDQDIINIVCKGKIKPVDSKYNFTSGNIRNEIDKRKFAKIIHYTGADKPWNKHHKKIGHILRFWNKKKYDKMFDIWTRYSNICNRKIKVALLIDEFFGGAGTAYGGYGFLARKFVAKYIPDENICLDVLLGKGKKLFTATRYHEDSVDLYYLPKKHLASKLWLRKQDYDIYLSIELTSDWVLKHETNPHKKLILWIQDPRPNSAWKNIINTMQSIKDPIFYNQKIYDLVHEWNSQGRVKFISQGYSLNNLASELYNLPLGTPIKYLPNPVDIDFDYSFDINKKKKSIIFLGRLEAQKRAWVFCEIAKRLPEYDFYVLGQFFRYQEDNKRMLEPYINGNIKNLHFVGHVDGEKKKKLIKNSRILCSTAIWEGIPISWLEALSYGTIIVSDLEREDLVNKFGIFVGENLGDGFDGVDKFIPAIRELMENNDLYQTKALEAISYIRKTHNIKKFQNDLRSIIYEEI